MEEEEGLSAFISGLNRTEPANDMSHALLDKLGCFFRASGTLDQERQELLKEPIQKVQSCKSSGRLYVLGLDVSLDDVHFDDRVLKAGQHRCSTCVMKSLLNGAVGKDLSLSGEMLPPL